MGDQCSFLRLTVSPTRANINCNDRVCDAVRQELVETVLTSEYLHIKFCKTDVSFLIYFPRLGEAKLLRLIKNFVQNFTLRFLIC